MWWNRHPVWTLNNWWDVPAFFFLDLDPNCLPMASLCVFGAAKPEILHPQPLKTLVLDTALPNCTFSVRNAEAIHFDLLIKIRFCLYILHVCIYTYTSPTPQKYNSLLDPCNSQLQFQCESAEATIIDLRLKMFSQNQNKISSIYCEHPLFQILMVSLWSSQTFLEVPNFGSNLELYYTLTSSMPVLQQPKGRLLYWEEALQGCGKALG